VRTWPSTILRRAAAKSVIAVLDKVKEDAAFLRQAPVKGKPSESVVNPTSLLYRQGRMRLGRLIPGRTPFRATWRSGYAADCKSVHAGSIPAVASTHLKGFAKRFAFVIGRDRNGLEACSLVAQR
jgi:hypothetical protein